MKKYIMPSIITCFCLLALAGMISCAATESIKAVVERKALLEQIYPDAQIIQMNSREFVVLGKDADVIVGFAGPNTSIWKIKPLRPETQ